MCGNLDVWMYGCAYALGTPYVRRHAVRMYIHILLRAYTHTHLHTYTHTHAQLYEEHSPCAMTIARLQDDLKGSVDAHVNCKRTESSLRSQLNTAIQAHRPCADRLITLRRIQAKLDEIRDVTGRLEAEKRKLAKDLEGAQAAHTGCNYIIARLREVKESHDTNCKTNAKRVKALAKANEKLRKKLKATGTSACVCVCLCVCLCRRRW